MIIDDFDCMRIPVFPDETDAPLIVDADAVLAGSFALEGFEPMAWRHTQVTQGFRRRELSEFANSIALNGGGKPPRAYALPNFLRLFVAKILNHFFSV